MKHLKENLLVQFSAMSFVIILALAVGVSAILSTRLNRNVALLQVHGAAMDAIMAPVMTDDAMMEDAMADEPTMEHVIKDTDPFSIPSLTKDIQNLRWITFAVFGGGFVLLYMGLVSIVSRGWRTINRQQAALARTNAAVQQAHDELEQRVIKRTADLHASEARFRGLVNTAPDAIVTVDARGHIVLANAQTEKMFGYQKDELIGKSIEVLLPGPFHQIHVQHRDKYLADPQIRHMGSELDLVGRRKDGSEFPAEISLSPLEKTDGLLVTSIIHDITERKRAEQALRESEERFKQLAETIDDVLVISDSKSASVLYASPAYEKIWGRPVQDLYEDYGNWDEGIHPDDRVHIQESWARMQYQGDRYEEEYRVIHTGGSMRWVRSRGYPVRDESGQVYRVAEIVQDITARKQQQEELRKSQALYSQAERMGKLGHWEWDQINDRLVSCSDQFARIYGMSVDEALAYFSNWESVIRVAHPDDRVRYEQHQNDSVEQREGMDIEFRIITRSGTVRHVHLLSENVMDDQGRIITRLGTVQNITARKQQEEALREGEARFRQLAEAVEDVFAISDAENWSVLYVNTAYEQIWGRPVQELLEDYRQWDNGIHPDDRLRVHESWIRRAEHGETYEHEYR